MNKVLRLVRYDWPLHFVLVFTNWLPDNVPFLRLRGWLASHFLGQCGRNLEVGRHVTFYNPSKIHLGNHVYIAYGCWFMAGETISIADEVQFGPYCIVVSSSHRKRGGSYRFADGELKSITIGSGSWVAGGVVITAGVEIGHGVVVGANSVVRGTIPSDCLAAGQPARVIEKRSE